MEATFRIASGVSTIAQTAIPGSAAPSLASMKFNSAADEILGTRMASGLASAAALRSASPQGVESPLTRTTISRLPKPRAFTASHTCWRATSLASGATASSRSRIKASAGRLRAFSSARAFEPGM